MLLQAVIVHHPAELLGWQVEGDDLTVFSSGAAGLTSMGKRWDDFPPP